MFGYVVPLKKELDCQDFALYRSFYCGVCKATGKAYGQLPRLTTNYDITFLSVLLYEYAGEEYALENSACVLNPFKKKVTVAGGALFQKTVAANIILSYYKALDGCIDREGAKMRLAKNILTKPYQKAAAQLPAADAACKLHYENLRALERQNCASPDRAADCFALLLKDVALAIVNAEPGDPDGTLGNLGGLCYNVGKFVYLADALDDIGEDFHKKRYNPFLAAYGDFTGRTEFIQTHSEELTFILASAVNRAIECFNAICPRLKNGGRLLQNILYKGLREKCTELLASGKKLKKPKI